MHFCINFDDDHNDHDDDDDDDDDRRREKGVTLHVEQIVEVVAEWSSEQLKRNFSTTSTATNPAPHNFATAKNLQYEYFCIWSILQKNTFTIYNSTD